MGRYPCTKFYNLSHRSEMVQVNLLDIFNFFQIFENGHLDNRHISTIEHTDSTHYDVSLSIWQDGNLLKSIER